MLLKGLIIWIIIWYSFEIIIWIKDKIQESRREISSVIIIEHLQRNNYRNKFTFRLTIMIVKNFQLISNKLSNYKKAFKWALHAFKRFRISITCIQMISNKHLLIIVYKKVWYKRKGIRSTTWCWRWRCYSCSEVIWVKQIDSFWFFWWILMIWDWFFLITLMNRLYWEKWLS